MKSVKMLMVSLLVSCVAGINAAAPGVNPTTLISEIDAQTHNLLMEAASTDVEAVQQFLHTFGNAMINYARWEKSAHGVGGRYKTAVDKALEADAHEIVTYLRSYGARLAQELMPLPNVLGTNLIMKHPAATKKTFTKN